VGVRVAPFTVRLGGWAGDTETIIGDLAPVDEGDLYKTDRRAVFLGGDQEVEVALSDVVGWRLEDTTLRIFAKGHTKPYVFQIDRADVEFWVGPTSPSSKETDGPIDPGGDDGWQQPGFPHRILLGDAGDTVVNADPLLPFVAAYLGTVSDADVDATQVAKAIGISFERASAMMPQLQALGLVGGADSEGERPVFAGMTVPAMDRDEASPPGLSPDEAARRQIALDDHDFAPDTPSDESAQ
jgi:hypothetical protein